MTIDQITEFLKSDSWLLQVALVLLASFITSRIRHIIINRVENQLSSTDLIWGQTTVEAIRQPAAMFIWIVGISFSIDIIRAEFQTAILDAVAPVRLAAVIATLTWFLTRFIGIYENKFIARKSESGEFDETAVHLAARLLRVIAVILGILVAMQSLGVNISGILAFGGVGGIAVGFAARELIANYFGAIMIFIDKPFVVGEVISSADREIQGTVKAISWRQTVIERFDTRMLYVPNAVFSSVAVRNHTRQYNRRIYEYVGIRYDDSEQLATIVSDIDDMLHNHPDLDQTNSIMVNFDRFAASSLDIFIYCFTKTTAWAAYQAAKQNVLVQVMDIITKHGAEIAFPTSTVHYMPSAVEAAQTQPLKQTD